ncbi:MAG: cysteine desulfurase [Planctomycetes bacterium]|nr:cysteine desulfurase [Planctomycetota bacterium]
MPIYLDNAATTRMLPEVADRMREIQVEHFGNPSSTHEFGERPRELLDAAHASLRAMFAADRIVLTSGGSEADLLGVAGAALARDPGRVLVGAADHPAVLGQAALLARLGYELAIYPTDERGVAHPDTIADLLTPDTRAVAILHGHNELGSLAPLDRLVPLVRERSPDAHIHVDVVQAFGKVPFDLDSSGVDSAAISAHKFHGPRGVGCLALGRDARITPLQPAGGQEAGLRGGTENVAGAVAMERAAEIVLGDLASQREHAASLARLLETELQRAFPGTRRVVDADGSLPQILSVRIPGVRGQTLQEMCAARGVAFSTGSACHSDDHERENHVLTAVGLDRNAAREVVRFSFCRETTRAEVERAATICVEVAHALQGLATDRSTGR